MRISLGDPSKPARGDDIRQGSRRRSENPQAAPLGKRSECREN